jgi:hypothetical protein
MSMPSISNLLYTIAWSLMIDYLTLSISHLRQKVESQSDYQIRRDTIAMSPTMVMFEEIRFLDGIPVNTTNFWRRDVSEFR